MKRISKVFCITTICTLLAACSSSTPGQLPTPQIKVTTAPDVDSTITTFLTAWKTSDYDSMYSLLSTSSKNMVSPDDFRGVYEDAALNMTLSSMDAELLRTTKNPTTATVATRVEYHTGRFGDFEREITIPLMMEDSEWRIIWENGLILPELTGGNRLVMEAIWGERGAIFDRNGEPIADETTAYALAITPNQIADGKEGALLYQLEELTGRTAESIKESYADIRLTNWYVAVGEASEAEVQERWNILEGLGGLQLIPFESRYYYNGGIAPQAVGYVLPISEEQVAEYSIKGYLGDEPVGQAGLEKYFEEELAGIPAASLYVVDANGKIISRLNQADPTPPQDITTTIDRNLQLQAQRALLGFRGAIVVMEVSTGRILAMASSPGFDQNLFTPENRNSQELLGDMLNDGQQRLLNRVTQGTYPLGSVFKIIGMAAALESDLYEPDTTYYCGSYFEELPGERFKDWTVDKELEPSGNLTLVQGLTRSCNPWFYHIGLDLFRQKGATYLSDMARAFGLGSATGIDQVAEDEGQIIDPSTDGDAVQQGIGQGDMLVTPLQVVRFTAALANGGTLYRPQIIERITNANGADTYTFSPQISGSLPISQETLDAIRTGMRGVVKSRIGTAEEELGDMSLTMYGKTGTAENPLGNSHAWFTGFTNANRTDIFDIAVTVIIENGGEGSEVGAPVFRRVIESYFFNEPLKLYPWESDFNLTRTPTPEFTEIPAGGTNTQPGSPDVPEQIQTTATPSG